MSTTILDQAREVFAIEAQAIQELAQQLDTQFEKAIHSILNTTGRLVVCGMGKSGHIGKKIAATLASTGTPSFFMHPSEAIHGDLGMLTPDDCFLSISNSGETDEILRLIPSIKRLNIPHITLVGNPTSTLAQHADSVLNIHVRQEACPLQIAPMASTTATLAMGDALAAVLIHQRAFKREQFALFHPGGSLGRKLLATVADFMQVDPLPIASPQMPIQQLLMRMSEGRLGIAVVCNDKEEVLGVLTDGDIRRALNTHGAQGFFDLTAQDIMTVAPKSVTPTTKLAEAEQLMQDNKITSLIVLENKRLKGVIAKHHIA